MAEAQKRDNSTAQAAQGTSDGEHLAQALPLLGGFVQLFALHALFVLDVTAGESFTTRLEHLGYEAGHVLGLGLLCWFVLALESSAWNRWHGTPFSGLARGSLLATTFVLLVALLSFLLEEDLSGFVARQAERGFRLPWFWIGTLTMSGVLTAGIVAAFLVRLHTWSRWGGWLIGVALALGNNTLLTGGYPGIHWTVAIVAAAFLAAPIPAPRHTSLWALAWVQAPVAGGILLGAAWTWTVAPSPETWRNLFQLPGSPVVSFLASTTMNHQEDITETAHFRALQESPWFQNRAHAPARLPTDRGPLPEAPLVVLLTVDALRADLFTDDDRYGKTIKHLRKLRDRSVFFEVARTPSPSTATTFSALYTGKYYSATRWTSAKKSWLKKGVAVWPSPDETPRVAELLSNADVDTVNVRMLNMFSKGTGVCRGFTKHIKVGHYASARKGLAQIRGELKKATDAPLFIAAHLVEPHAPYSRGKGSEKEKYLAEVRYVDRQIGEFLSFLRKYKHKRRVILIIASDHGEAFGEHGNSYHATTMYEEVLRVPLLIHSPALEPRRVQTPVSIIDLGPTILDFFNQPTPGWFMGETLVPSLLGEPQIFSRPLAAEGGRRIRAFVSDNGYKAIVDLRRNTVEVYDLEQDPDEKNNLAGKTPEAREALSTLRAFFQIHQLEGYDPPWRKF